MSTNKSTKVEVKNLTKIFGKRIAKAKELSRQGKDKSEILKETGATVGVDRADFKIYDGEIFVIMGLSGSGKSTLVRMINRLIEPTEGEVLIDGENLMKMDKKKLRDVRRKKMSMVFQNFGLLPNRTILENAEYGLEIQGVDKDTREKKANEALETVGITGYNNQYPDQPSGGMQQRVGLARALANDTKVLLCDEATSALDPQTTKAILELIRDINKKLQLTVVVITREMQVIKDLCDKVAVLDHGVIAENGTVLEIFTNPKEPITKEFMSVLSSNELPAAYRNGKVHKEYIKDATMLLRLTFIGESADNPVIAGLIRKFPELDISILFGDLSQIQMVQFGRMIIGLDGKEDQIKDAIKSLMEQDLKVEVIGYVQRRTHATA